MTIDESLRIARLQSRVYRCIEDALREDSHHKSYEGAMDITLSLPNVFEHDKAPQWTIELHCYVLPENGRHHSWTARTLAEAIAKAEDGIGEICREWEQKRFDMAMECVDEEIEADGTGVIYGGSRNQETRQ